MNIDTKVTTWINMDNPRTFFDDRVEGRRRILILGHSSPFTAFFAEPQLGHPRRPLWFIIYISFSLGIEIAFAV